MADQSNQGEDLDGEEVGGSDLAEVGLQERLPRQPLAALGRRFDAVFEEDSLDGVASDIDVEVVERTPDSAVSPPHVFVCHPNDEGANLVCGSRSARSGTTLLAAVVLVGDQLAVPAQDGVGRGDGSNFSEELATEGLPLYGQASPPLLAEADRLVAVSEPAAQEVDIVREAVESRHMRCVENTHEPLAAADPLSER